MLVISLTLATFGVDKKVPERHEYGMSDHSRFERKRRTTFKLKSCLLLKNTLVKYYCGRLFQSDMF